MWGTLSSFGAINNSAPNINNGIEGLKAIYDYVADYRLANGGIYPKNMDQLLDFMEKKWSSDEYQQSVMKLENPDVMWADYNPTHRKNIIDYALKSTRINGSPVGSVKLAGTKDIIATTSLYVHSNPEAKLSDDDDFTVPNGHYLVLWDNGTIDKVPFDEILYAIVGDRAYTAYYEQAGVPTDNLLTYEEYINAGASPKSLPIGKPIIRGKGQPVPDNGGPEGLITFSRLFNYPDVNGIDRAKMWKILDPAQEEFTLDQMQSAAAKLGLFLQKKTITLDELQKLHTPVMLYLSDAGRIVTMSTIDDNHAIIYDRGMTLNVSREELAKRYGGEALIAASINAPSSLQVDQPIRTLEFSSKDAEVVQNVKITNDGTKPISLLIERPLCGITDAKLSQDNIAPGASANLELHFKWRDILPGDHQSTFVTLKTDDPPQPRLQLGFDLKLAEAAK